MLSRATRLVECLDNVFSVCLPREADVEGWRKVGMRACGGTRAHREGANQLQSRLQEPGNPSNRRMWPRVGLALTVRGGRSHLNAITSTICKWKISVRPFVSEQH